MKTPSVLLAATAVLFGATAAATAEPSTYRAPAVRAATISHLRAHVNHVLARKCLPAYRLRTPAQQIAPSYRRWVLGRWLERHRYAHRAREHCSAMWASADRDFHVALAWASRTYGVSYSWLHACDHTEGSDRMVSNHGGSGAFGPMQFMSGTFYSNVHAAFALARARGVAVPSRYKRLDSNVGQAFTAAYMFSRGWSGQWTGAGC